MVQAPQADVSISEFQRTAKLRAALRRFLRVSENAARRQGITPRQHNLLVMIKGAPEGRRPAELARRLAERGHPRVSA